MLGEMEKMPIASAGVGYLLVVSDVPPPELRFRRRLGFDASLARLIDSLGVIESLTQRTLRSRYKRNFLGPLWVLISPLTYLLIFTTFYRQGSRTAPAGVPYGLFVYTAMVPWQYFASSLNAGATSIQTNISLLKRLRAPAEVYPISAMAVAGVDTFVVAAILPVFFVLNGRIPSITVFWLPLIMVGLLIVTAAPVLLLSALVPYVRDLRQVIPVIVQLGIFATPIAYELDSVGARWRPLLCIIDPVAPVIDAFRRCLLTDQAPQWGLFSIGVGTGMILLVVALKVFRRLELGFADVS